MAEVVRSGQHLLGPHVVGQRVVIRRVLPGQVGPSGGPAMTDVLGICVAWADGEVGVRTESGEAVRFPVTHIVSGKPVPPRASIRARVAPQEAQTRALALWPDVVTSPLGGWLLRSSATSSARRANSVLAMTPAGVPGATDAVVEHYRGLGRRPIAAVLPGSAEEAAFADLGWVALGWVAESPVAESPVAESPVAESPVAESPDGHTVFQIASVAHTRRGLRELTGGTATRQVQLEETGDLVVARIGPVDDPVAHPIAWGTAAYADDWVGFRDIEVAPDHRRQGLGVAVMAALLGWGAERGALTAYLQVLGDNAPALALFARLGFRAHHTYRYLAEPVSPR